MVCMKTPLYQDRRIEEIERLGLDPSTLSASDYEADAITIRPRRPHEMKKFPSKV